MIVKHWVLVLISGSLGKIKLLSALWDWVHRVLQDQDQSIRRMNSTSPLNGDVPHYEIRPLSLLDAAPNGKRG